jgi:hypothetical protein
MIMKKGKPITGAKPAMKPKPPVKTTTNTSADAEKQIKQPPQPFANKKGPVNVPISGAMQEDPKAEMTANPRFLKHTNIGHMALPKMSDAGQKKPINHSGNVFGRFGTSHPKRKGAQNLGASRKNATFYGEHNRG